MGSDTSKKNERVQPSFPVPCPSTTCFSASSPRCKLPFQCNRIVSCPIRVQSLFPDVTSKCRLFWRYTPSVQPLSPPPPASFECCPFFWCHPSADSFSGALWQAHCQLWAAAKHWLTLRNTVADDVSYRHFVLRNLVPFWPRIICQ